MFWWAIYWKAGSNPFERGPILFLTGIVFPLFYATFFFESLNKKSKGMFYFSLPVSSIERIAVTFTYVMVIFPILMFTLFNVFDFVFIHIFNQIHDAESITYFKAAEITLSRSYISLQSFFAMFLGCMSLYSISMLCSLRFGKKGNSISFPVFTIFVIICLILKKIPFSTILNIFIFIFPVFWIMMYFAMKKREV